MEKELLEMTLEELWELFPIYLTKHKPEWKDWFKQEYLNLKSILPKEQILRISHIGSTSIDTIWAKPIIDILVETTIRADFCVIKNLLLKEGYLCMLEQENRLSFNKGYTKDGFAEKVFHLHLRRAGDHDELYFRDYLIEYPYIAKEYEELKLNLWKQFEHNRDAYTESKTDFIKKYTSQAKQQYGTKYK